MPDTLIIPSGKYKGKKITEVPAMYLKFLWVNNKCSNDVFNYILNNLEEIKTKARAEFMEELNHDFKRKKVIPLRRDRLIR